MTYGGALLVRVGEVISPTSYVKMRINSSFAMQILLPAWTALRAI